MDRQTPPRHEEPRELWRFREGREYMLPNSVVARAIDTYMNVHEIFIFQSLDGISRYVIYTPAGSHPILGTKVANNPPVRQRLPLDFRKPFEVGRVVTSGGKRRKKTTNKVRTPLKRKNHSIFYKRWS